MLPLASRWTSITACDVYSEVCSITLGITLHSGRAWSDCTSGWVPQTKGNNHNTHNRSPFLSFSLPSMWVFRMCDTSHSPALGFMQLLKTKLKQMKGCHVRLLGRIHVEGAIWTKWKGDCILRDIAAQSLAIDVYEYPSFFGASIIMNNRWIPVVVHSVFMWFIFIICFSLWLIILFSYRAYYLP
jgi:hypothetical protein